MRFFERKALLRAATDVEAERRVDSIHAFVIQGSPGQSKSVVRLPEAGHRVLRDKCVQRIDHGFVLLRLRSVPVRVRARLTAR